MSKSGWIVLVALAVVIYASAPAAANDNLERQIYANTNLELQTMGDLKTALGTQAQAMDVLKGLLQQNTDTINSLQGKIGALQGVQVTQNTSITQLQQAEGSQFTGLGEQIGENARKIDGLQDQIKNLLQTIQTMQVPAPGNSPAVLPAVPGGGGNGAAPAVVGASGGAPLAALPPATASAGSPAATAAWNNILNAMGEGQYTQAQIQLGEFMSKYPNDPNDADAKYWLGVVLYDQKQYSDAISQLGDFIDYFPDNAHVPSAQLYRGLCYAESGQKTEALRELRDVVKSYPGSPNAKTAQDEINALTRPH